MEELGAILKKSRDAKGVSLEVAAAATKIKIEYLKALEEEGWEQLPPPAYVKGFLKIYGRFLNLDSEPLLQSYEQLRGGDEPQMVLLPPKGAPAVPLFPRIRWSVFFQVLGGLAVLVVLIIGLIKWLQGEKVMEVASPEFSVMDDPYSPGTVEKISLPAEVSDSAGPAAGRKGMKAP